MSAQERAAALREQADRLDSIADLEEAAGKAKAAYQDDRENDRKKSAHRKASQALATAREALRAEQVQRSVDAGGVAVTPQPANGTGA